MQKKKQVSMNIPQFSKRTTVRERKFQVKAWELLAEEVKKGNTKLLSKVESHFL